MSRGGALFALLGFRDSWRATEAPFLSLAKVDKIRRSLDSPRESIHPNVIPARFDEASARRAKAGIQKTLDPPIKSGMTPKRMTRNPAAQYERKRSVY
jgi:hypothetical protein